MISIKNLRNKKYNRFYIYKITNPNDMVYIGGTSNIESRRKIYGSETLTQIRNQKNLYESIKKYGWIKHQLEVLEEFEWEFDPQKIGEQINLMKNLEMTNIIVYYYKNPAKSLNMIVEGVSKEDLQKPKDI